MPVVRFDVDPVTTGIGYGFDSFMEARRKKQAENKARTEARKAAQKQRLIVGASLAAGAVGGIAAAGPLGLAGTAAGTGMFAGVPATAGILGSGGVGGLGAGLLGAQIGANFGNAISEGDIAGGVNAVANPILGLLNKQEDRRLGLQDRATERAGRLSDALALEGARTAGNIEQARATDPRAAALYERQQNADFADAMSAGPFAGQELGSTGPIEGEGGFQPIRAMGPMGAMGGGGPSQGSPSGMMGPPEQTRPNIPGPSDVPGMSYQWSNANRTQLAKLEHDRVATVDNPQWAGFHDPELRAAEYQALARRRENIHPTLMQDPPTMQQIVKQQTWTDPESNVTWHGKDVAATMPSKKSEETAPWLKASTPEAAQKQKEGDLDLHRVIKDGNEYLFDEKQGRWEKQKDEKGDGADIQKRVGSIRASMTKVDDDGVAKFPSERQMVEALDLEKSVENAMRARPLMKEADEIMASIKSGNFSGASYEHWVKGMIDIYGTNMEKWPDDVRSTAQHMHNEIVDLQNGGR